MREELIVAWDACPKDRQRYGPDSQNVREVADLIDRTPAAVSLVFGNLWAVHSAGTSGLTHYSAECRLVVEEFRKRPEALRSAALEIREKLLGHARSPRIEIRSEGTTPPVQPEALKDAAKKFDLVATSFFVASRGGSLIQDIGIVVHQTFTSLRGHYRIAAGATLLANWVEQELLRGKQDGRRGLSILRSRTWVHLAKGDEFSLMVDQVRSYLPKFRYDELPRASLTALFAYLALIRGLKVDHRQVPGGQSVDGLFGAESRPSSAVRRDIEREVGGSMDGLCDYCLGTLGMIVSKAKTIRFQVLAREQRRRIKRSRLPPA